MVGPEPFGEFWLIAGVKEEEGPERRGAQGAIPILAVCN